MALSQTDVLHALFITRVKCNHYLCMYAYKYDYEIRFIYYFKIILKRGTSVCVFQAIK